MHLTLNYIRRAFLSLSYDFMFDRIICVLVRIKVRGHLVMSIIQFMHLINVHNFLDISQLSGYQYETSCSVNNHITVYTASTLSTLRGQISQYMNCMSSNSQTVSSLETGWNCGSS